MRACTHTHSFSKFWSILTENDSQVTQHFLPFLFVVLCETKNSQNLCSDFMEKKRHVLLNALCLLTSLSCQFFCSAFVVAKDLCASSFVSDRRCQGCPFDVDCTLHTRRHLCSPSRMLQCAGLHVCKWLHVGVAFCDYSVGERARTGA